MEMSTRARTRTRTQWWDHLALQTGNAEACLFVEWCKSSSHTKRKKSCTHLLMDRKRREGYKVRWMDGEIEDGVLSVRSRHRRMTKWRAFYFFPPPSLSSLFSLTPAFERLRKLSFTNSLALPFSPISCQLSTKIKACDVTPLRFIH